jgi:hypothetical protein
MPRAPIPSLPGLAAVLGLAGLASACVNIASSGTPPGASATPSAAVAASAPPVASAAAPKGVDADVAGLQKLLHCGPDATSGPCKVLAAMTTCTVWNAVSPSGEGRYIGRGWLVGDGGAEERVTVLRSRSVPAETASWQLPVKISIGEIPKDAGPAFAQSGRAVNAYERHDVPPAKNAAIDYLKQKSDWRNDSRAVRTSGSMVETFSDEPAYLCQGPQHDLLLVQQGFGAVGKSADGLYAQLWAATW